jgi:hypothetical protein
MYIMYSPPVRCKKCKEFLTNLGCSECGNVRGWECAPCGRKIYHEMQESKANMDVNIVSAGASWDWSNEL